MKNGDMSMAHIYTPANKSSNHPVPLSKRLVK